MNYSNSEELIKTVREKIKKFQRAENGDLDALMQLSLEAGINTQEQIDDFYRIQEEYGKYEDEENQ